MKKTLNITLLSMVMFYASGCKVADMMANIKPDSSVLIYTSKTNNTRNVEGEGTVYLKNIATGREETLPIRPILGVANLTKKVQAGKYLISKWTYNACKFKDKNGLCESKYDFIGTSSTLTNKTFEIKKGGTIYLGRFVLESVDRSLSLIDNSEEDIVHLKNHYNSLKSRTVKNEAKNLKFENWEFKIK